MSQKLNYKVAAVVLNYNSAQDCRGCCRDLARQQDVDLEIVVVDNCSREDDRSEVETLCKNSGYTFITAENNGGYNAGNNIGLRYAAEQGAKYALIANPDMRFPDPGYVVGLVEAMDSDKEIVVAGTDIVNQQGVHQNPFGPEGTWQGSMGWVYDFIPWRKRGFERYVKDFETTQVCFKLSGCAILLRMDFIKEVGYFDEGVFLYCEEAILSRQVERAHRKMLYLADLQALHCHRDHSGNRVAKFREMRNSRLYFIDKYSGFPWYGKVYARLATRLGFRAQQVVSMFRC